MAPRLLSRIFCSALGRCQLVQAKLLVYCAAQCQPAILVCQACGQLAGQLQKIFAANGTTDPRLEPSRRLAHGTTLLLASGVDQL